MIGCHCWPPYIIRDDAKMWPRVTKIGCHRWSPYIIRDDAKMWPRVTKPIMAWNTPCNVACVPLKLINDKLNLFGLS